MVEQIKKFSFDVGWAFLSGIIPIFIALLIKPILARWLGADGLGLYSLSLVIYGMSSLIANFGTSQSLVKYGAEYKDKKDKLYQLIFHGFITSIIFGIVVGGFLYGFSTTLASFFNMPELAGLLPILAFGLPFTSLFSSVIGLLNGLRQMGIYVLSLTVRSCLKALFIIPLVILGFGVKGAILGIVLSDLSAIVLVLLYLSKYSLHLSLQGYLQNAKKLISFGGKMFGGEATNALLNQIDTILIGYYLIAKDVGYYSAAIVITAFLGLIPGAIQRITFPAASEFWSNNNYQALNKMIDKSMKYSTCILLFIGLGVGFFAREIMGLLFGPEFICAVVPLWVLLIARVIRGGTVVPIGNVIPAIGRPDVTLKLTAISAGMNVGLNILFIPRFGILGAAIATAISLISECIIFHIWLIKLLPVKIDFRWYIHIMGIAFIALVSFFLGAKLINSYLIGSIILSIYAILILKCFFTKEDRIIFVSLVYSLMAKKFSGKTLFGMR